ncbi:hypothetical protein ACFQE2_07495 [Methylophaga thalassica]|uniref:hypothetical protein n=1 Tax=Methylophaga thalassica TaxID=40223 RepID=UPI0025493225|nr:hypothetical protein [Methylophaga thalassica]
MKNLQKRILIITSLMFGLAGVVSLLLTDAAFVPRAPNSPIGWYFSSEPILLISVAVPPAVFAYFASYRWHIKGSRFFNGWLNVALFSWLSLVINPVIWVLVLASFFFFGFVVLHVFLLVGLLIKFLLRYLRSE